MDYVARLHLVSKPKNKDLIIRHLYDAVEKRNWKPNPNDTKQQQKQDKKTNQTYKNPNPTELFQVIHRRLYGSCPS